MEPPNQPHAVEQRAPGVFRRLQVWSYSNRWLIGMGLLALVFYFAFDPVRFSPVPPCPMHTMTGLECPGCGGQRALHALLRGDVAKSWQLNPLVPLAAPLLGLMMARRIMLSPRQRTESPPLALWKIGVVLLLLLAFTIYRNLTA